MSARSRTITSLAAALTFFTVTAALAPQGAAARSAAQPPAARCTTTHTTHTSVPFVSGQGGYATYRIPAVVRAGDGALLAFAEGRVGGSGDSGSIDIVLKRSRDGGCTWGPQQLVAAGNGDTRGNPAPVVDPRTGRITLLSSWNSGEVTEAQIMRGEATAEQSRRIFVQQSGDGGRSFSAPRDITADTKLPSWRWYATGPGHAIALTHGPHRGRLVVPANHSSAPTGGSSDTGQEPRWYGGHVLLSDDGGRNWRIGFAEGQAEYEGVNNANESQVAQLPDGRLYFTSRDQHGTSPGNRLQAYSEDGGATLAGPFRVQPALDRVPIVQAGLLQAGGPRGPLLFSGPSVPTARSSMALWSSLDGGATFTHRLTLSEQPAAYSDLVQTDQGAVGILYETGVKSTYETIEFRRIPLRTLR